MWPRIEPSTAEWPQCALSESRRKISPISFAGSAVRQRESLNSGSPTAAALERMSPTLHRLICTYRTKDTHMNDNSHNQSPGAPIAAIAAPGDIEPPQGINVSEGGNSQKVTAADLVPQRTGLLATARDPRTQMPAAELRPDTLVTVSRVPMRLAVAERLGFVRRASTDEYVEVDAAERADKADKAKQEQEAKREAEGAF